VKITEATLNFIAKTKANYITPTSDSSDSSDIATRSTYARGVKSSTSSRSMASFSAGSLGIGSHLLKRNTNYREHGKDHKIGQNLHYRFSFQGSKLLIGKGAQILLATSLFISILSRHLHGAWCPACWNSFMLTAPSNTLCFSHCS